MIYEKYWNMSIPVLHPCRNHNLDFGPFCDNPIFFFLLLVISEEIFDFYHFLLFNPVSPWNLKYFNAVRTEIYLTWFPLGTESNYFWYFLVIKDHCFWILTKMLITCYVKIKYHLDCLFFFASILKSVHNVVVFFIIDSHKYYYNVL